MSEIIFNNDLNEMLNTIDDEIQKLNEILYKKPYSILFGRIGKNIQVTNQHQIEPIEDKNQFVSVHNRVT